MPTYEYKCRDCGERIEVWQSFSAEPLRECEQCGGELGKVFGNIGITFKGSGFYKTDSRSTATAAKTNGKDKADAESETKSDSKSDSKTSESKPAAKSESKSATPKAAASSKDSGSK